MSGIAGSSVFGQTTYIVTDVTNQSLAQVCCRLNKFGDIVGRATGAAGQPAAAVWTRGSMQVRHLTGLFDFDYSCAFGINDNGAVVGSVNSETATVPFIWTVLQGVEHIPVLPGDNSGEALAVNRYGHVVGYSSGRYGTRAFLWSANRAARNLGVLPGGAESRATGLNDADEIVGTASCLTGRRAVLWTKNGNIRDLGTLPGDWASEAAAINNHGDVVGYSKGPRGIRAFLWSKGGGMRELGILPGFDTSRALDVNDFGQVVGASTSATADHAFIWTKELGMVDLNSATSASLGITFMEAHAINAKGQILVTGGSNPEDEMSMPAAHQICAPAPPSTFLLTPTAPR